MRVTLASGDASGPYDYHLTAHLKEIAEQQGIPLQRKLLKAFHSDTASALIAGHDVRTALIAYAGDASHSVERTHIDSLTNVVRMLEAYVCSEPTFVNDPEVTTVGDFPRQINPGSLPQPTLAPDTATVITRDKSRGDKS
jgi:putative aminopeptidase FrvX